MSKVIEVVAELYTPQAKETITVELNWYTGSVSFWDRFQNEQVNSRVNYDFTFVKRGWIFTDFACRHLEKPLTYKLTFFNRAGDQVRELVEAT